jgi:hypothetical protein
VPFTANYLEDSSLVGCYAVSTSSLLVGVPKRHCGFIFSVKHTKNIIVGYKRDGPCAETRFRLSEKRTSTFESAGGVSLVRL